jgi:hypothetical protein
MSPPHRALASLETLAAAPLDDAAGAILLLAFGEGEAPGSSILASQMTLRAQELLGPATGLKGGKLLRHFQDMGLQMVINESVQALERSLLVYRIPGGTTTVVLTRRGRRALDSGRPERWVDVPAEPV